MTALDPSELSRLLDVLDMEGVDESMLLAAVQDLPPAAIDALLTPSRNEGLRALEIPDEPAGQALQLFPRYIVRPHTAYLSRILARAVADVERGVSRRLLVSMPPRMGKSTLVSLYLVIWLLRKHPDWAYMLTSHDSGLATSWGRTIQQAFTDHPALGITLARNPSAASEWGTIEQGSVLSRSIRGSITGRGARVLIIDDPVKDFVEAHSALVREATWNWWLTTSQPRLEPPSLVLVVMTRWHEDDFAGRILSKEHEGNPDDWEVVRLPALADSPDDVLGRSLGEPLLSPLLPDETLEQAVERWEEMRRNVGMYAFASMYQQRPAPAKGAIFDLSKWRYWTSDPANATDDGRVVHLDAAELRTAFWLDSWDCAFKGADDSDFVVGQRWARLGQRRFLIAQQRDRWTFTQTLERLAEWCDRDSDHETSPYGRYVHERLIEASANGVAIIDVMKEQVPGIKPLTKSKSKEAYARAVTPEIEEGLVYLPHPGDPGNEWVAELLDELRNFPHGEHDDQVDALTQALLELKGSGSGKVTVPQRTIDRNVARTASTDRRRSLTARR